LDPVSTGCCDRIHPTPCLDGVVHPARYVRRDGETRISSDARSDDFVSGATATLVQRPMKAVEGSDLTDGRDSVAEPQFVYVFGRWYGACESVLSNRDMRMGIDEARQHIHAAGIDLIVSLLGTALLPYRDFGIAHARDPDDAILLDHDVDRAH